MADRDGIGEHYNKIPNRSIKERRESEALNIRNFNNFIKSCLFRKYINAEDTVLDMGIGKGGDFKKYNSSGVAEVFGLDIANRSLLDALARARKGDFHFKLILKIKDCYGTLFDLHKKFNIISIQFSFHYAFANEDTLDCAFKNISHHIEQNGYVLITTLSKKTILSRRSNNTLSNRFYKISFSDQETDKIYGMKYTYSLIDSINDCVEYLVDMNELIKKSQEYGFKICEHKSFKLFFDENVSMNEDLYEKMELQELDTQEAEVIRLHDVIVLKRQCKR